MADRGGEEPRFYNAYMIKSVGYVNHKLFSL